MRRSYRQPYKDFLPSENWFVTVDPEEMIMRFLVKVNIPVEAGNQAARAGKLGSTIQSILAD